MASAGTDHSTASEHTNYHVVCHDCPTELLTSDEDVAEALFADHRSSAGHNVELVALNG